MGILLKNPVNEVNTYKTISQQEKGGEKNGNKNNKNRKESISKRSLLTNQLDDNDNDNNNNDNNNDNDNDINNDNNNVNNLSEEEIRMEEKENGKSKNNDDKVVKSSSSKKSKIKAKVYFYVFFAALNSINLGYDIGVFSGAKIFIQEDMDLSDHMVEQIVGLLNFTAMISAGCAYLLTDKIGRRRTFTVSCLIFILGVVLMAFAPSVEYLIVGRGITGIGVGFGLAIDPLYIAEISPAEHRGGLVSLSELSINLGIFLGFVSNYVFTVLPREALPYSEWRCMLLCAGIVPTILIIATLTCMPETPRFLIQQDKETEARKILEETHDDHDGEVNYIIDAIYTDIEQDKEYNSLGWKPILQPTPTIRRMLYIGLGVAFIQQITGIESVIYFSPEILTSAEMTSKEDLFLSTIFMGLAKCVFIALAAYLLDHSSGGRRKVLILSLFWMACSLAMIAASIYYTALGEGFALFSICSYVSAFSIGLGPVCWLIASEVFPMHIRARALGMATMMNRGTSAVIAFSFLSLSNLLSYAGYFVMMAIISLLATYWVYSNVPETKGLTLEEMTEFFTKIVESKGKMSVVQLAELGSSMEKSRSIEISEGNKRRQNSYSRA